MCLPVMARATSPRTNERTDGRPHPSPLTHIPSLIAQSSGQTVRNPHSTYLIQAHRSYGIRSETQTVIVQSLPLPPCTPPITQIVLVKTAFILLTFVFYSKTLLKINTNELYIHTHQKFNRKTP